MTEPINTPKPNRMAAASKYTGILAAVSAVLVFLLGMPAALLPGMIFGCLGILFAHLSKGETYRYPAQAMAGLGTSIFAISVCILMILMSILGMYIAIQMFGLETVLDPEALQEALTDFYTRYLNSLTAGGGAL